MINAIACVSANWGLGKKNGLLFNIKADLNWFKQLTSGHVVVMGYNTLLSLPGGKPLKNRTNIVLAPKDATEIPGCTYYHNFNELVTYLKRLSESQEIWIVGGAMFYNSMLPYYDKVYLTKVDAIDPDAEVFFPNLDENPDFKCEAEFSPQIEGDYTFKFTTYKRIK